jgi:hypothetical protein
MATEFTFEVLPFNQGYCVAVRVDDPAGAIETSIVWEFQNITPNNLRDIKSHLLWRVEMVQIDRNENGVYDAMDVEDIVFDHDWDRYSDDEDDDIPF